MMKDIHRKNTAVRRHYTVNKSGTLRLKTKFLYAGQLSRSAHWTEEPHSHKFCEVIFVRSGTGVVHFGNGTEYALKKGDLVIYNPGVVHGESTKADREMELCFFGVSGLDLPGLDPDCLIPPDQCPVIAAGELYKKIDTYFSLLVDETVNENKYCDIVSGYLVKIIILNILHLSGGEKDCVKINDSFSVMLKHLDDNYTTISSIDDITTALFISRYYLSHVFREYTGMSPMHYIVTKRLELAKKLLVETDLPIKEIAVKCGYSEQGTFFKAFRKNENTTPINYRDTHRVSPILRGL